MNIIVAIVPLFAIGLWALVLMDWHHHCINRRDYWLAVLVLTNIVGYYFFINSPDRQ